MTSPPSSHATPTAGLGRAVMGTLGRQILHLVLVMGYTILVARAEGPEGGGRFALCLLLPAFLTTFLNAGLGPAHVYHLAREDWDKDEAVRMTFLLVLVAGLLGLALALPVILWFREAVFPGLSSRALLISLATFPLTLLNLQVQSIFQGLRDFPRVNRVSLFGPAFTFVGCCLALAMGGGTERLVLAFGLAQLGTAVATVASMGLPAGRLFRIRGAGENWRRALRFGWKAHLSNVLTYLSYRTDQYLLNLLVGAGATGVYGVAVQLGERLWMLSQATSAVLFPTLAREGEERRRLLTSVTARWMSLLTLVASMALWLLGEPLVGILFGSAYLGALDALGWLLPGIVAAAAGRVYANDLAARGLVGANLAIAACGAVINLVANLRLIPAMGVAGAALSSTLSYSLTASLSLLAISWVSGRAPWELLRPNDGDRLLVRSILSRVSGRPPS